MDDGSALAVITGHAQPAAALAAGKVAVFQPELLGPGNTVPVDVVFDGQGAGRPPTIRCVVLPAVLLRSRPGVLGAVYPAPAADALRMRVATTGVLAVSSPKVTAAAAFRATELVRTIDSEGYVQTYPPIRPRHSAGLGAFAGTAGWPYRLPGREPVVLLVGLPPPAAGAAFLAGLRKSGPS